LTNTLASLVLLVIVFGPRRFSILLLSLQGYKLEFLKKPLGSGIKETSVSSKNIDILQEEIDILIQKDVIEPVPQEKVHSGFYKFLA
jgi:hypothetical protein